MQRRSQQLTLDVIGSRRGYSSPVGDILPFLFRLPLLISYTPSLPTTIFSFYFFFPSSVSFLLPLFGSHAFYPLYNLLLVPPSHVSYFFFSFIHLSFSSSISFMGVCLIIHGASPFCFSSSICPRRVTEGCAQDPVQSGRVIIKKKTRRESLASIVRLFSFWPYSQRWSKSQEKKLGLSPCLDSHCQHHSRPCWNKPSSNE